MPHSEAWYSADTCEAGEKSDQGHPDNPRGDNQIAVDALEELAKAQPDFDWASYDVEDQQDLDHDGDLFEPNGVLDHVVVVHAGDDQSDGGGAQGTYALWAVSQVVDPATGGYEIGNTGYKVFNVTFQPEDATAGVIAHEFGHDLGLPDLYDNVSGTDPDTALLGHHEQRLAVRPPQRHPADEHGRVEQVRARLADPEGPRLRQPGDAPSRSGRRRGRRRAPRRPSGSTSRTRSSRSGRPHSGENAW